MSVRENPNSTLFEDETFSPVEVLCGNLVYIWQEDADGERSQITTTRETAARMAQHLLLQLAAPEGRS